MIDKRNLSASETNLAECLDGLIEGGAFKIAEWCLDNADEDFPLHSEYAAAISEARAHPCGLLKTAVAMILTICFLSLANAALPELHDTTIAIFPNTNPGDSLRFREISYNGVFEKLVCYAIGKTIFPFKITNIASKDTFPEFDSAEILVSETLANIADNYYASLIKNFPSLLRTDTETIIESVGGGIYTTYCQCHALAIVFSFTPNKKEGVSSGDIDATKPALVVRDIFTCLRLATPTKTSIISKNATIASRNIKTVSRTYLLNGRSIPSRSISMHKFISYRIISK